MIFFSKRQSKGEKEALLNNALNDSQTTAKDLAETQKKLDKARANHERITDEFRILRTDPVVAQKSRAAAASNEAKLDKMKVSFDAMNAAGGGQESKMWEMEKDIYIVPGGYAEMPSDSNDIPKTNLDVYNRAIEALERGFLQKTAADAVDSGADRLESFVIDFIGNLRSALETGRALKANACIDMIKYVLVVGYRYEDASDLKKFEERVNRKVEFISSTGRHLIEAIDHYYNLLLNYELDEEAYAQALREFDKAIEPYKRDCPSEIKEKLDRLGFKRAMRELPAGDDARKYMGMLIASESYLTRALMGSLRLEAFSMEILTERGNIQELINECKKAFAASGDEFDFHKHVRMLEQIRQKNINEINKLNDMVAERENLDRRTQALLEEAAENEKLADAVANAAMAIDKYENIQKRNQTLAQRERETRNAYAVKQKEMQEKELEQQRLEQEELERIQRDIEEMEQQAEAPMEIIQEEEEILVTE